MPGLFRKLLTGMKTGLSDIVTAIGRGTKNLAAWPFKKQLTSLAETPYGASLRYHGIPTLKIVNIIKMLYKDLQCKVICCTKESLQVTTRVKQGCLLSLLLFILAMDWIVQANCL